MQLNASRIKVLQAQDDLVNQMKEDAMKELLNISSNHHEYRKLLEGLVVQVCFNIHTAQKTSPWFLMVGASILFQYTQLY
jgi:hypothetical protein